jgi:hypothetical protein
MYLLSFLATGLIFFSGCANKNNIPSQPMPVASKEATLWFDKITGDDDAKAKVIASWIDQASEQGYFQEILNVSLPNERRIALALYRSAVEAYHHGDAKFAKLLGKRADEMIKDRVDWTGRIEHERVPYVYWRQGYSKAEGLLKKLPPGDVLSKAEAGLLAEKIWGGEQSSQDAAIGYPRAINAMLHRSDLAGESGKKEGAQEWITRAISSANAGYPGDRPYSLCKIVSRGIRWSDKATLRPLIDSVIEDVKATPYQIEDRILLLAEAAQGLQGLGEVEEAKSVLILAEQDAKRVPLVFRPVASAAIANAWILLGNPDRAEDIWLQASKDARSHIHPRARMMNAIGILMSYGKSNKVPSPAVRDVLDSISRGEGGDMVLDPGWTVSGAETKTNKPATKAETKKKNTAQTKR